MVYGRVALITGARRVGLEIAKALLEKGYHLSVVYRSSEGEARSLEDAGKGLGRKVLTIRGDLSEEPFCEEVVERTFLELGRIDAFLHLASPYLRTPLKTISEENIQEHFKPIAQAFLLLSREVSAKMMKNEGKVKGRIIAFGDWAVEGSPYKNYAAYFVAKGALHTAVKVLAKELAPHVLVNCIALGPTLKADELTDEEWERILRNTPLRREVPLRDVLKLTEFLLEAEGITGEVIRLDGGRHIAGSGAG